MDKNSSSISMVLGVILSLWLGHGLRCESWACFLLRL